MAISIDLSGRTAIVTGGGRGIGRGITERLLAAGADVVICGRNQPASLPAVGKRKAHFVAADVRQADQAQRLVAATRELTGRLDILVNNAGGAPAVEAATVSPRFHEAVLRLNLLAPLHCAQAAHQTMAEQAGGGCIINISSVSAIRPSPGTSAYSAAKGGVLSLTQSLAAEWGPRIRVNALILGLVETERAEEHYGDAAGRKRVAETISMGRLGTPREVGDACAFLASPLAGWVSGATWEVHGGNERPGFLTAAAENDD